MNIPFNKPHHLPSEVLAVFKAARAGTISGNGLYTKKCNRWFEEKYGFRKALLTTSCTDALEMTALLAGIQPGDEVIAPSFTFVSTANAFLLRGAKVVFADTEKEIPDISSKQIEELITSRTKAIVVVHYSGIACDMDPIMEIARKNGLVVIEDAAHSIDSFYKGRPLGSIGDFGSFSFHETKNIFCGEGGLLAINKEEQIKRAEIIWEKGTNRAAFYRGEVNKYNWVDLGSSYLPSDAIAALLMTQLNHIEKIQKKRIRIWKMYHDQLSLMEEKGYLKRPVVPDYATVNGNMYYIIASSGSERDRLMGFLKKSGINAVFHYLPLHSSPYFTEKHVGRELPNTDRFSDCIVRLPFFYDLKKSQISYITEKVNEFYSCRNL